MMAKTTMTKLWMLLALSWACSGFTFMYSVSTGTRLLGGSTVRGFDRSWTSPSPSMDPPKWQIAAHSADRLNERSGSRRKKAWPRRIWSKITRKGPASRPLRMQTIDAETEALLESVTSYYQEEYGPNATAFSFQDDFIFRNFEEIAPGAVLPELQSSATTATPALDEEFFNVKIEEAATVGGKTSSNNATKAVFVSRWLGMLFENILTGIIERNAQEVPEGLHIQAFPTANAMGALMRGQFCTDAQIDVGRLVFPAIRMSGGRLEIKRLTLQLLGFLGQQGGGGSNNNTNKNTPTRFPKQFDLHAHDWTFSRHDLLFSPCLRNGLRLLLVHILRDRGLQSSSILVNSLDILPSGKISVKGQAKTLFDSPLNFEVRSFIDSSTRGHVLTFPGLEVSLSGDLGLFFPVVPTIDIDVGHNARFREIHIDGTKKQVRFSASVTITPSSTIHLNDYQQSKEAFSARFSTDVGRWLTHIGNFIR